MKPFLTANWTNLINLTWAVPPGLLLPYLPQGTELDLIDGNAFVSLVPFDFTDTRFKGIRLPYHVDFPEINLRFYVKHGNTRGVVFIKELIPRFFVKAIANTFYNEHYETVKLRSAVENKDDTITVRHDLVKDGRDYFVEVSAWNKSALPAPGSMDYYFEERFYGYCAGRNNRALVFHVEHPSWELYPVKGFRTNFNFAHIFGKEWWVLNDQAPVCAMLVRGSAVKMFPHRALEAAFSLPQRRKDTKEQSSELGALAS